MKKVYLFCCAIVAAMLIVSCSHEKKHEPNTGIPNFTFTVDSTPVFNNLPELQSFAFGTDSAGNWILLGGRTNGLHNFSTPAFPINRANAIMYRVNPTTGAVDSFGLSNLFLASVGNVHVSRIIQQFISNNVQHTQIGKYLYMCGGYGPVLNGLTVDFVTNNIMSKVDLNMLSQGIATRNVNTVIAAVANDTCSKLSVTGGELFKLADGRFYLAVGHQFNGEYGNAGVAGKPQPTQVYSKCVWSFTVNDNGNFAVNQNSFSAIPSTPQYDSTSIFRRRDLVVVPSVMDASGTVGLSIYGGVFTYTGSIAVAGNPFHYPIYINGVNKPHPYIADSSFYQRSNLYSAANLLMYSNTTKTMYTTIFGGLVDTTDFDTAQGGNPASWTKQILTIGRTAANAGYTTATKYNPTPLFNYIGAEGLFIPAPSSNNWFYNSAYNIVNYDNLPSGKTLVGYIYGGIVSNAPQSGGSNPTNASGGLYKVYINK